MCVCLLPTEDINSHRDKKRSQKVKEKSDIQIGRYIHRCSEREKASDCWLPRDLILSQYYYKLSRVVVAVVIIISPSYYMVRIYRVESRRNVIRLHLSYSNVPRASITPCPSYSTIL